MTQRKYFGTDGIRGKVGESNINPEFVTKLGWAAGKVLAGRGTNKVLIGKDTRISGYMLESSLEAGLSAAGINIGLLGPMPTPAIAYLTKTFRSEAGIVISASHNPFYDNGIKFFSAQGFKLDDDIELAIEDMLERPMTCVASDKLGKATRINDAAGRYIEFCKGTFPSELSLTDLKIVVDCAHGATYHIAPNVLRELGVRNCEKCSKTLEKSFIKTDHEDENYSPDQMNDVYSSKDGLTVFPDKELEEAPITLATIHSAIVDSKKVDGLVKDINSRKIGPGRTWFMKNIFPTHHATPYNPAGFCLLSSRADIIDKLNESKKYIIGGCDIDIHATLDGNIDIFDIISIVSMILDS